MEKNSKHDNEPEETFTPAPIPVSADGGIDAHVAAGLLGQPAAVPERTPEHFICMRGPCRHYWHLVTMAQEGNPEDTWAHLGIAAPRQHHYTCLVNPGYETAFGDDNAYECSKWNPMTKHELVQLKHSRDSYYNENPEHRPARKDK